jgi:ankyrin repeat protein
VEVARLLLEHGADANAQNKYGLTPFRLALGREFEEVTELLLQYDADPDAEDNLDTITFWGDI